MSSMNGGDQAMRFWISADVESHAAARRRNKRRCRPGRLGERAVEWGVCCVEAKKVREEIVIGRIRRRDNGQATGDWSSAGQYRGASERRQVEPNESVKKQ